MVTDALPAHAPRLLAVAHGTASQAGVRTARALVAAVGAARPGTAVELCFLDLVAPSLADALAAQPAGPTVVVPLLLSTGYHVQADIPALVAGRSDVRVARHLGPHPLLVDALVDRLADVAPDHADVLLVGAGSTRTGAAAELAEMARLLGERLGAGVATATMADDLRSAAARAGAMAAYLLAEGQFVDSLRAAAGTTPVAAPLGVHPAVVRLVWLRYDEVVSDGSADGLPPTR